MTLTAGSFYQSDKTGTSETIKLVPLPPAAATQATIASAVYGNPNSATVAANGLSLTIPKVLSGVNSLVVTVVSPNPNDTAALVQGTTSFAQLTLNNHWAASTIQIYGT